VGDDRGDARSVFHAGDLDVRKDISLNKRTIDVHIGSPGEI
jgi:hypothetical protein